MQTWSINCMLIFGLETHFFPSIGTCFSAFTQKTTHKALAENLAILAKAFMKSHPKNGLKTRSN